MLKEEIAGMTTGYTVNAPQWVTTFTKAPEFKSFIRPSPEMKEINAITRHV